MAVNETGFFTVFGQNEWGRVEIFEKNFKGRCKKFRFTMLLKKKNPKKGGQNRSFMGGFI